MTVVTYADVLELLKAREVVDAMRMQAERDAQAKRLYRAAKLTFAAERLATHLEGRRF